MPADKPNKSRRKRRRYKKGKMHALCPSCSLRLKVTKHGRIPVHTPHKMISNHLYCPGANQLPLVWK